MKTSDAVAHFGTAAELARRLDIRPQAVYQWGEYPPRLQQLEIQSLTLGKLMAEPKPVPMAQPQASAP